MTDLTHVGKDGTPRMVDVSPKPESRRLAVAEARVFFAPGTLRRVMSGELPKGPVLDVARVAGIQGAKQTSTLIPLCHPLRLTDVDVTFEPMGETVLCIRATTVALDRTGVEMEAMTAVSIAALTVYDMTKAVDRRASIGEIRLLRKEGGKSGTWVRES